MRGPQQGGPKNPYGFICIKSLWFYMYTMNSHISLLLAPTATSDCRRPHHGDAAILHTIIIM